jgi:hypothetical protein
MRLVCLHADTVEALSRLNIQFDDLTPTGLWSSQYHLVGLTPDQVDALAVFGVEAEDITPAQLAQAIGSTTQGAAPRATADGDSRAAAGGQAGISQGAPGGQRPTVADRPEGPAPAADEAGREPARAAAASESEVPLAQARDAGSRPSEPRAEQGPETKSGGTSASLAAAQPVAAPAQSQPVPQASGQKGGKGGQPVPQAQGNRKGQPQQGQGGSGGQRYGTTRLRISVAGKYTEATVANGKIVVSGRSFDSPDQAAAELTKSRGDWTFWEYYDSTDGKWRMLTRDWDSVLKSATPGGR